LLPGDFQLTRPSKKIILIAVALGLGSLGGLAVTIGILAFVISAWFGLPLPVFGFNEGPDQPIAFPHTVHVEQIGLDCTFCHRNVTKGAAATIPAVGLCMTCHKTVGDGKPEVEKLRDFHAAERAIDWIRVHRVPDHVRFVHEAHVRFFSEEDNIAPSATCSICHGDVGGMVKVKQVFPLKMGDCVDCHRDNDAPTDCTTCHY
jgi:hypothetical protein